MTDLDGATHGDPVTVNVPDFGWAKAKFVRKLDGVKDPWGRQVYLVSLLERAGWLEKYSYVTAPEPDLRRGRGLDA